MYTCWSARILDTGDRKNSRLFIWLLKQLARTYQSCKCIHLVVDNCCIHKSKATLRELEALEGKIRLHFLPPYCPQENKMELVWLHLHHNVTRNHRCSDIEELMAQAEQYLRRRTEHACSTYRLAA